MRVVTIAHPTGDRLPILLDSDDLPIPSPNEFIYGRRALSTNTLVRNLREVAILYKWLEDKQIDLITRLESKGKLFSDAEIRGSLIEALRKKQSNTDSRKTVTAITFNQRLTTLRQFIVWYFDIVISSLPHTDNSFDRVIEHKKRVMRWLDSSFINSPPATSSIRKGLNSEEVNFLISCLDPNNPDSTGQNTAVRFRNYISVLLMINLGLRPGELLSLKVEDVVIGAISSVNVVRRPPDPNGKRKPRPCIKRNGRILNIDDNLLIQALDEYILTFRDELEEPADKETEFLIISDEGDPLSQDSLGQLFRNLRHKFPNQLPSHLTPKALRHTFSSEMERILRRAGLKEEKRSQALAELRGDSSLQSQNTYISQEIEDQVRSALMSHQRNKLKGVK